jgi:signal transduction histidine kinase
MPESRVPRLAFTGVATVSAAFVVVALALASDLPAALDLPVRDAFLRFLPSRPPSGVAVVAIDEDALDAVGPWPWPRARLAELVDAVRLGGSRGLAVDVLLAEPAAGDETLAQSLSRLPSILAVALDARAGWVEPAAPLRAAAGLAETSFDVDHDGVVRRLSSTKQRGGVSRTALSLAAAGLSEGWQRPVPVGRVLVPDFRCRPGEVPVVGAATVLGGRADAVLRGRVVFLGITAAGLGDRYVTPGGRPGTPEPGVLVHAAAAACILDEGLLRQAPPLLSAAFGASLAGLALAVQGTGRKRRRPSLAALVLLPAVLGIPLLAAGIELPLATLSIAGLASALWAEARAVRREETAASLSAAEREEEREARRVAVHDMKTPLTAVRGLTQLLSGLDLTPEERQRVTAMVGEETERLGGMIESLNAAERLRLRDFDRSARALDLGALAEKRALALGTASAGRVRAGGAGEPVFVQGDEPSLARAIDNLIGNALKFSPPGSNVLVTAGRRGNEALVAVADEGPGIPEAEREQLFGRFVRGSGAAGTEGLGLGLSLVHEVVTWHRGRVSVRNGEGPGSVFEIALPLLDGARPGKETGIGLDPRR